MYDWCFISQLIWLPLIGDYIHKVVLWCSLPIINWMFVKENFDKFRLYCAHGYIWMVKNYAPFTNVKHGSITSDTTMYYYYLLSSLYVWSKGFFFVVKWQFKGSRQNCSVKCYWSKQIKLQHIWYVLLNEFLWDEHASRLIPRNLCFQVKILILKERWWCFLFIMGEMVHFIKPIVQIANNWLYLPVWNNLTEVIQDTHVIKLNYLKHDICKWVSTKKMSLTLQCPSWSCKVIVLSKNGRCYILYTASLVISNHFIYLYQ